MSRGPEKMLIRCSTESRQPAENWASGPLVEHQENEKDTTLTAISLGSKCYSFCSVSAPSHMQTLNNVFEPLQ